MTPVRYCIDPRPDLSEDSATWTALLHQVAENPPLLGALHAARCQGMHLEWKGSLHTWVLIPRIDAGHWPAPAAYQGYKTTYLLPHAAALTEALQALPPPVSP